MVGPLVRPELRAWTARWSEALVAVAILLAGSWLALRGGWFFAALGTIALLVPVDAAGSDALADAFTALPDLDMGAVSAALAHVADQPDSVRTVWRRAG